MNVAVTVRTERGTPVLTVTGEVDVYTSPRLRERMTEVIDGGAAILVVDLDGVDFLDSTGLGILVAAHNRVSPTGGAVRVVCTQERLLKLFRITGLDSVFQVLPTVSKAIPAATDTAS